MSYAEFLILIAFFFLLFFFFLYFVPKFFLRAKTYFSFSPGERRYRKLIKRGQKRYGY